MSGDRIKALQAQLFARQTFVCGGHGARRPKHGVFTVPKGITIYFYVRDTESLPNDVGQRVDQILTGGAAPRATGMMSSGGRCHNYHLYSPRSGGYLSLGMSSKASDHYISTTDKINGIALADICQTVMKICPEADIHWSACRAIEGDNDVFPDTLEPDYSSSPALQALASKVGKV